MVSRRLLERVGRIFEERRMRATVQRRLETYVGVHQTALSRLRRLVASQL